MYIKIFIVSVLFSSQALAEDIIHITVKTTEQTAAGIGYSVEGKTSGTFGKTYSGKGIKNKEYVFGYRKHSIAGTNIRCGSLTLTKDTVVTLVIKGDKCFTVINE